MARETKMTLKRRNNSEELSVNPTHAKRRSQSIGRTVNIGPEVCEAYIRERWESYTMQSKEHVYAIYLNDKFQIIFSALICMGSYTETTFDLRQTMQYAFNIHSDYVVLAHNHPKGSPTPSDADLKLTKKIAEAFNMVDLFLLDHLILTQENYYSFSDAGILPKPGYN